MRILATDADAAMLARARHACYGAGSVRELPEPRRAAAFAERDRLFCLRAEFAEGVTLMRHDIRSPPPEGQFDLVLCRNLAFTYFDLAGQRAAAARLAGALRPGGALVIGAHEALPPGGEHFARWSAAEPIYRRL
jgi:chemotaxis protein methyltransferase CheR